MFDKFMTVIESKKTIILSGVFIVVGSAIGIALANAIGKSDENTLGEEVDTIADHVTEEQSIE